jgi:hypothetical protein
MMGKRAASQHFHPTMENALDDASYMPYHTLSEYDFKGKCPAYTLALLHSPLTPGIGFKRGTHLTTV